MQENTHGKELSKRAVNYGIFKDDDDNPIAVCGNRIWGDYHGEDTFGIAFHSLPTSEEIERQKEVLAAYNAGYDFATGKYLPPPNIDPNKETFFIGGRSPTSNAKSQEIYNSTYNRLRNNAVA